MYYYLEVQLMLFTFGTNTSLCIFLQSNFSLQTVYGDHLYLDE